MKITLTGSLGRIARPLAITLLKDNHEVTVVSSSQERAKNIEAIGAKPAIGRLQDIGFLTSAFEGADAVFTLAPPANYFDTTTDLLAYFKELGNSFSEAVRQSGVSRVINLSSIGAHLESGNGILEGTYHVEQMLNKLRPVVAVTHLRPTEIYYNLYQYIDLIKNHGIVGSNLDPQTINVWVATEDIAKVAFEELIENQQAHEVRYIASQEITYKDLATVLGEAIGSPNLQWIKFTDEQLLDNLTKVGMHVPIAKKMVEMYAAINSGLLYEDYNKNRPTIFGQTKVADFAKSFAAAYNK